MTRIGLILPKDRIAPAQMPEELTKADLMARLDALGISYSKRATKAELQKLLEVSADA